MILRYLLLSALLLISAAHADVMPTYPVEITITPVFLNPVGGVWDGIGTNSVTTGTGMPAPTSLSMYSYTYQIWDTNEVISLSPIYMYNGAIAAGSGGSSVSLCLGSTSAQVIVDPGCFTLNMVHTPNTTGDPILDGDSFWITPSQYGQFTVPEQEEAWVKLQVVLHSTTGPFLTTGRRATAANDDLPHYTLEYVGLGEHSTNGYITQVNTPEPGSALMLTSAALALLLHKALRRA